MFIYVFKAFFKIEFQIIRYKNCFVQATNNALKERK